MFLDNILETISEKSSGSPITWGDLRHLIIQQRESMLKVNAPDLQQLSYREKRILKMMCDGCDTTEIGEDLGVSARTVETLRINLKKKLGAKNIAQMVVYAVRAGLVIIE